MNIVKLICEFFSKVNFESINTFRTGKHISLHRYREGDDVSICDYNFFSLWHLLPSRHTQLCSSLVAQAQFRVHSAVFEVFSI